MTFVVDVTFASHDDMHDHRIRGVHRVIIDATDDADACQTAAQIVFATQDCMPIQTDICI